MEAVVSLVGDLVGSTIQWYSKMGWVCSAYTTTVVARRFSRCILWAVLVSFGKGEFRRLLGRRASAVMAEEVVVVSCFAKAAVALNVSADGFLLFAAEVRGHKCRLVGGSCATMVDGSEFRSSCSWERQC